MVSLTMSTLINLFAGWAGARLSMAPLGPILLVVNEVVAFGFAVALFVGL